MPYRIAYSQSSELHPTPRHHFAMLATRKLLHFSLGSSNVTLPPPVLHPGPTPSPTSVRVPDVSAPPAPTMRSAQSPENLWGVVIIALSLVLVLSGIASCCTKILRWRRQRVQELERERHGARKDDEPLPGRVTTWAQLAPLNKSHRGVLRLPKSDASLDKKQQQANPPKARITKEKHSQTAQALAPAPAAAQPPPPADRNQPNETVIYLHLQPLQPPPAPQEHNEGSKDVSADPLSLPLPPAAEAAPPSTHPTPAHPAPAPLQAPDTATPHLPPLDQQQVHQPAAHPTALQQPPSAPHEPPQHNPHHPLETPAHPPSITPPSHAPRPPPPAGDTCEVTPAPPPPSGPNAAAMDEQDNGLCSICLEDYCCSDVMRVLPCGHFFHQECVDTWMDTQAMVCPLCRTDLRVEESPRKRPLRRRNPCALCFRGSSTAADASPSSGGGSTRGGTEGSTHRQAGGQGARAASADHLPV